jgi:ankyrin repeat protein
MKKDWEQAIRRGDVQAVRELIDQGEPIDSRDRHGQTALMIAAMRGQTELAALLVERHAALNITAKYNLSALMLAVVNGHADLVRLLCEAGADRSVRGTGAPGFAEKTALDLAEGAGRDEIAASLREKN